MESRNFAIFNLKAMREKDCIEILKLRDELSGKETFMYAGKEYNGHECLQTIVNGSERIKNLEEELTAALAKQAELQHEYGVLEQWSGENATADRIERLRLSREAVQKELDEASRLIGELREENSQLQSTLSATLAKQKEIGKIIMAECRDKHQLSPLEADINGDHHVEITFSIKELKDFLQPLPEPPEEKR